MTSYSLDFISAHKENEFSNTIKRSWACIFIKRNRNREKNHASRVGHETLPEYSNITSLLTKIKEDV